VADRIRSAFINLDDLLASGRFVLSWSGSDLAERNPLVSDFLLDTCRVIALVEAVRAGGQHLVVVDESGFGVALRRTLGRAGIAASFRPSAVEGFRSLGQGLRAHLAFLRTWFAQRRALKHHCVDARPQGAAEVVLMTWWDEEKSFSDDGFLKQDRHLGQLAQWLREGSLSVRWLGNLALGVVSVEALAQRAAASACDAVVLINSFFGLSALLRAYWCYATFPMSVKRRFALEGVDLSAIVSAAVWRELRSPRLASAALYLEVAPGLKRAGLSPAVVAYPFENQPWEKMMLAGFRRELPATRMIGIHHSPFARNYVSGFPGNQQWQGDTVPDRILTMGEEYRAELAAAGAPPGRVVVAGSLRFGIGTGLEDGGDTKPVHDPKTVLATCPIDLSGALELARAAVQATASIAGLRLIVNFHPDFPSMARNLVIDEVSVMAVNGHIEFVDAGASTWLKEADVLLYNSSATSFEAALLGVPSIFVGSSFGLDLDKMQGEGVAHCRSTDDLRGQIMRVLDDEGYRRSCVESALKFVRRSIQVTSTDTWVDLVRDAVGRP
jgi:surface carbohydrate biosynthesis protein (TIGR04326 family)